MMHIKGLLVRSIVGLKAVLREARKRKGDNHSTPVLVPTIILNAEQLQFFFIITYLILYRYKLY